MNIIPEFKKWNWCCRTIRNNEERFHVVSYARVRMAGI